MSTNTTTTTTTVPALLVNVREAARLLSVSEKSVWNAMDRGKLPYIHILGARRIRVYDLERLSTEGTR